MKMLKISMLAGALLLAQSASAQITVPAPYCNAGYDDAGGSFPVPHFISNVTLGSLNNTTGDTQYAAPHYVYYNEVAAPDLEAGHTYSLSVTHDPTTGTLHYVAVFIDYNHNNSFDDAGERVLQQTTMTSTITNPSVVSVTIPATATPGITRMRVMVIEDDGYSGTHPDAPSCTADATGYLDWGETEDYNVNITAPTGVAEINKNNSAFLYPNPATGSVHIDESLSGADMAITDLQGRTVQRSKVTNASIDITQLAPGAYFIKVVNKGVVNTQVLFVEK